MEPLLIVIAPDGTILGGSGVADALSGTPLQSSGLPVEVREAGAALIQRLRHTPDATAVVQADIEGRARTVQMVTIDAVPLRRQPTDVRRLLSSKLAVLSSQALMAHVTLRITVADDVPATVDVDAEKISWAVTTLVGNALRYVQAGPSRDGGGRIDVNASMDAATREIIIDVRDNGPGIPAASVARLFKRDGLNVLGSGLALLVMADVCAAHRGRIEVTSSMEAATHGTSVRLTFPARADHRGVSRGVS
jgi:signal transduction histidine kinase